MFRGQQLDAIELIRKGLSPILIISGTGSGKSLYFQLPALISDSDSLLIIIVPLISLRLDLLNRFNKLGLRAKEWDPNRTALDSRILLITYESALTQRFLAFAQR